MVDGVDVRIHLHRYGESHMIMVISSSGTRPTFSACPSRGWVTIRLSVQRHEEVGKGKPGGNELVPYTLRLSLPMPLLTVRPSTMAIAAISMVNPAIDTELGVVSRNSLPR